MTRIINKIVLAFFSAGALAGIAVPVYAANWLMLQGAEPAMAAPRANVWGFVQPEYQTVSDPALKAGAWSGQDAVFNLIRPDLKTESTFNIIRARIGVRGQPFPLDPNVNYFFLAEFGNNGITRPGGGTGSTKLTDGSVTLSHIPGARIRIGQFKTPGSEEGLQAIHVFDYINFTNVTNQLTLERFFDGDGSGTPGNGSGAAGGDPNKPNGPVSAFRDIGVQVFDAFVRGDWEHSYAVMVGNGNGITRGDNDDNKETYLYWSSELVYGGKGPRRKGLKLFAWSQDGKRTLTKAGAGEFDRERRGAGVTYRKDRIRAGFEWIDAEGMIFNGTDGGAVAGAASNGTGQFASFNVLPNGEADGWYVEFGYYIRPNWTIDLRYDVLNRGTETSAGEREFTTFTVGSQYFFNKKSRILVNYEIRDAEAPNLAGSAGANQILDSMDNRIAIQFLAII